MMNHHVLGSTKDEKGSACGKEILATGGLVRITWEVNLSILSYTLRLERIIFVQKLCGLWNTRSNL